MKKLIVLLLLLITFSCSRRTMTTVNFPSKDGLGISADLYLAHPITTPFILLCHQADYSRGEYRTIAPKLNDLGFNCMAIDQRSGNSVKGVENEIAHSAQKQGLPVGYIDALPDIEAAIAFAKKNYAHGTFILWGSSYSASLALRIAGDQESTLDAVMAFSPGEYFSQGGSFIADSAKRISIPTFITSGKYENDSWKAIYDSVPSPQKQYFLPSSGAGAHGSQALWTEVKESREYWKAVRNFLTGINK